MLGCGRCSRGSHYLLLRPVHPQSRPHLRQDSQQHSKTGFPLYLPSFPSMPRVWTKADYEACNHLRSLSRTCVTRSDQEYFRLTSVSRACRHETRSGAKLPRYRRGGENPGTGRGGNSTDAVCATYTRLPGSHVSCNHCMLFAGMPSEHNRRLASRPQRRGTRQPQDIQSAVAVVDLLERPRKKAVAVAISRKGDGRKSFPPVPHRPGPAIDAPLSTATPAQRPMDAEPADIGRHLR